MPIPPHTHDVWAPELASSGNFTMMVYGASGGELLMDFVMAMPFSSYVTDNLIWPNDPITLAPGSSAKICWTYSGFYVAVNSGSVVLLYHADSFGNWDGEEIILSPNGEVTGLDIWGLPVGIPVPDKSDDPDVFLAVETWGNPPDGPRSIQFASHNEDGWSDLETVLTDLEFKPFPQMTSTTGPTSHWPTIFYVSGAEPEFGGLMSITKDPTTGWQDPVAIPGDGISSPSPFAGEFDVVSIGNDRRSVLGLGPTPTCPCGTIHHQAYGPGGWQAQENLTQPYEDMDWPKSPRVTAGSHGRVHAFWYQLASGPTLEPLRKTLEYHVLENGNWTNRGEFLNSSYLGQNFGERVAVSVGLSSFPVLAYTRRDTVDGEPQPETIWVARRGWPGSTPDNQLPQQELNLTAWPNPFNPQITIAFEVEAPREARLEVFDARGRRVALLLDRVVEPGSIETVWNGRGENGMPLPSGVYYARLEAGEFRAVKKLVLAK